LEFERAFELFGFDDGVDPELPRVVRVGALQSAFAALQQPPCAAMDHARRRCQHELDAELVLGSGEHRDE
jgi:hypothetical protein